MTIIALVSAAILGTASAALEAGRRSRTQSLITKINGLVMERWDSYAERRVEIAPVITQAIDNVYNLNPTPQNSALRGNMLADARLLALRELMKREMPDRWSDLLNDEFTASPSWNIPPTMLAAYPPVMQAYRRALSSALDGSDFDAVLDNQRAECLYLIVMNHTGDGEARTLFTAQDFGDVDGDGLQEFHDGWGQPIEWIRWPAGFLVESMGTGTMTGDADADHDPFDVFRRDSPTVTVPQISDYQNAGVPTGMIQQVNQMRSRNNAAASYRSKNIQVLAFRLVPLIYSGGPDQLSAMRIQPAEEWTSLDPYQVTPDDYQAAAPDPGSDEWKDNITNHLNEY